MAGPMWLVALLLAVLAIAIAARLVSREAQRRRLLQIVEAAPVGIVLIDRYRAIVALNAAIEKLFGRSRESLVGKPIEALIPKLFSGEHEQWFAELIGGGAPRRVLDGNLKGRRGDGRGVPIELDLAYARIDRAPHVVATIVDVTDRMRREAATLAAKDAAEASERTRTQFLAHISHEIRTPLHTVIGLTEATLQTDLSATQRDHLRTVLDAGESLLSALDFLDFTRISSGSLELDQIQFDLHDTVRTTLDSLAIRAQDKGLSLSCSIDPPVPVTLVGDPARLRQVLTNLLDNAIKFTAGGEVAVRVELEAADGYGFNVVYFAVVDTGPGIAAEQLDRIFEPFEHADPRSPQGTGSGLGLSICQQLVELMGGQIGVESKVGVGSTFHFTVSLDVPYASRQRGGSAAAARSDPSASRVDAALGAPVDDESDRIAPKHILLVEDSAANQKVAIAILEAHGHSIAVARNGREGVERAAAGGIDAVLMDVEMPIMDGLEATAAIRAAEAAAGGHVPIIAMTAHTLHGDRERCLAAGMDDYIAKPIRRRELFQALARATRKG